MAVKDASGNLLKSYAYDGLHRRVRETAGCTTTDLYYSAAWQVLEERVTSGGTSVPRAQYVWSPVYVDALILRDRDTNGDGTLDERLWVVQDANYNVTALFDNSGNVVERYIYDPFGQVTILASDWSERAASAFAWLYLHQGGRYDATSSLYHFRHRDYSPTLGRWTSLDPLRYDAGDVNLYRTVFNAPTIYTDPSGQIAAPFPDNCSYSIAIQNAGAGGMTGFGGGLWWALTFENRPDPAGNARLGYKPPHGRWQRSFHFDAPHGGVSYPHFNAEFGPLRRFNHARIPNWLYRFGNTNTLRTVARGTVVVGVAWDIYTIVTAPPGQRGQAIGGAVGGWGGAAAGAAIGSMICPGVGTVIGGLIGGFGGGAIGSWIGSWF